MRNRYSFDQACRVKAIETSLAAGLLESDARLSINFLPNAVYSPMACIQLTWRRAGGGLADRSADFRVHLRTRRWARLTMSRRSSIPTGALGSRWRSTISARTFRARHVRAFVPDEIKLDMDLVRNIDSDMRRRAIVRAVVQMCRELDTLVIAEGVETSAEAETLRGLGVRYHQGFWYARPAIGELPKVG